MVRRFPVSIIYLCIGIGLHHCQFLNATVRAQVRFWGFRKICNVGKFSDDIYTRSALQMLPQKLRENKRLSPHCSSPRWWGRQNKIDFGCSRAHRRKGLMYKHGSSTYASAMSGASEEQRFPLKISPRSILLASVEMRRGSKRYLTVRVMPQTGSHCAIASDGSHCTGRLQGPICVENSCSKTTPFSRSSIHSNGSLPAIPASSTSRTSRERLRCITRWEATLHVVANTPITQSRSYARMGQAAACRQ